MKRLRFLAATGACVSSIWLGLRCLPGFAVLDCGRNARPEDELLQTFFEDGPLQHHAAVAGEAAEADVGPKPRHLPVVAAAGMGFAKPDNVAETNLEDRPIPPPAG